MPKGILSTLTKWSDRAIYLLYKQASTIASHPELVIKRAPSSDTIGKFLFVIPKKVGTAPERNLIRRRLKAIVYEHQLYTKGYNCLFLIKPSAKNLSFGQLAELVIKACSHE